MLAQVREVLGDREGARAAIELCQEVGGQDDVINYAITHAVRARLALTERDSEAAERWARSAVDRAFETDFTFTRGETLLTLALVLEKLDRRQESMTAARRALELYEAKCDRPGASQARAQLEHLGAGVIVRQTEH
jgi:tetratricopeptide (TPR) repeat protein